MAIKRQMCVNHPERAAIGVCMMTKRPICAECSTRYEGVNYSKEGLEVLRRQREAKKASVAGRNHIGIVLGVLSFLPLVYLLFFFYKLTFTTLIDFQQEVLHGGFD